MEKRYSCGLITDLMLTRQKNNKTEVLLSLRKNTGYRDGEYELPGGHVEANEDLMKAMVREAKEELLIDIKVEDLQIVHILHHYKGNRINFILTTNNYEGVPSIGEPNECENLEWFDVDDLPINIIPKVKRIIEYVNKGIFYSTL